MPKSSQTNKQYKVVYNSAVIGIPNSSVPNVPVSRHHHSKRHREEHFGAKDYAGALSIFIIGLALVGGGAAAVAKADDFPESKSPLQIFGAGGIIIGAFIWAALALLLKWRFTPQKKVSNSSHFFKSIEYSRLPSTADAETDALELEDNAIELNNDIRNTIENPADLSTMEP